MLAPDRDACSGPGSRPGARRPSPSATATRSCSRRCSPSPSAPAIDWFWEIAALGAFFFLAAGVAVAAPLRPAGAARPAPRSAAAERRFGLTVAGLAVAWIAAIALIGPLLVEREIKASQRRGRARRLRSAVDHADTARSIEPWAASPYVQLGLLAELQGDYPSREQRLTQAIDREDRNWQLYYLRSRVEHEAGDEAAARADLRRGEEAEPAGRMPASGVECG